MPCPLLLSPARRPSSVLLAAVLLLSACGAPSTSTEEPLRPGPSSADDTRPAWDRAALDDVLAPDSEGLLPRLGIAASDADALHADEADDPIELAGALTATFDAPVAAPDGTVEAFGTAQVTLDGVDLTLASGVLVDAAVGGIAYAVLFDPDAPSTWVVVAAHASDLATGATLPLDGMAAAAIVLDELTGEARVALGGSLSLSAADLSEGGSVVGALSSDLVAVDLESWPHDLFPLADGAPGELPSTAEASASGTFSVPFVATGDEPADLGTVDITAQADGLGIMTLTTGYAYEQGDGYDGAAFVDDNSARMIALVMPPGAMTPGATIALDGGEAAAWWIEPDGSAWFFTSGSVTIDDATLASGGVVSGALSLSGEVIYGGHLHEEPGDPYDPYDPPPDTSTCDQLAALPSMFTPASGAVLGAAELGGDLPPGYGQLLYLEDAARTAALQALIPAGADLAAGVSLGQASSGGNTWPEAILASYGCETDYVGLETASLVVTSTEAGLLVSADFTVDGDAYSYDWTVAPW
jgi:hypothetical protein